MRKLGLLLGFLGGFLVTLALLAKFYAPGQLMRTPIDVDSTTRLAGTAALGTEDAIPVKATSITRTNSEKSTSDVVVWVNSSCLVKDEGDVPNCVSADDPQARLISASVDNFATDRKSAEAINDPEFLPADATKKEGLVNKWPFEAAKKTYKYWDGTAGKAVDAVYSGTEKVGGIDAYKYLVTIDKEPIEITDGVNGTYTTEKQIFVEPLTGSILNQVEHQVREDDEGGNFLTLDLAFTPDQVAVSAKDAKANVSQLNLIRKVVPLVGFIGGIPLLVLGLLLALRGRRDSAEESA